MEKLELIYDDGNVGEVTAFTATPNIRMKVGFTPAFS